MEWLFLLGAALVLFFGLIVVFGAPYVPSQRHYVRRLFEHLQLGTADTVVDLGSGDGMVLRAASAYGARAVGYELNPFLWAFSRVLSWGNRRVQVRLANAWTAPFPDNTTLVYIFSVGRDERRILRTVSRQAARLERPLRLVCLGNALKSHPATETFEAYHLYVIEPGK